MSDFTIRPSKWVDYPQIVRMLNDLAAHVSETIKANTTIETLEKDGPDGHGHFEMLVAEQGETLVGLCLYTRSFSSWRGASGLYIEDLYVDPTARGAGLGKALISATAARERSARYIKLEVATGNHGALAFYKRLGMNIFEGQSLVVMAETEITKLLDSMA
jgi:ribosomal protein S18 acetylase RimI-like enzyme